MLEDDEIGHRLDLAHVFSFFLLVAVFYLWEEVLRSWLLPPKEDVWNPVNFRKLILTLAVVILGADTALFYFAIARVGLVRRGQRDPRERRLRRRAGVRLVRVSQAQTPMEEIMKKLILAALLILGCSPRRDHAENHTLGPAEEEYVILIALGKDGGEEFASSVIDRYFRDRAGTQDKLIISRLSGGESLVWEGTPLALRKQFPSNEDFKKFLAGKASEDTKIYAGLHHALEYVLSDPRVASGKAKVGVFVMSKLIDSGSEERDKGYMNHDLSELGWRNGVIGLYYADQSQVLRWRQKLQFLNVKNYRVESEIVGEPPLPSFE